MDSNFPPPTSIPPPRPRTGLAIAALVLGILAVFSSILVVGALVGLLAILLGVIHIMQRRGPNGMAWVGITLSVLGIALSVGLGALYFTRFQAVKKEWSEMAASAEVTPVFPEWIGREVPDFTVTTLEGKQLQPSEWRGRRVVLDFWATWCPPCRLEIPHFIRLANENSQDELLIIGVSSEDEQTLKEFVEKEGINYPIVSANDLPAPFDAIEAIPTTFFIDRNGLIQNVVVGYHDFEPLKELAIAEDLPSDGSAAAQNQP